MTCNEVFDWRHPDTFFENVQIQKEFDKRAGIAESFIKDQKRTNLVSDKILIIRGKEESHMKMYQLNCPACGATIEIEKDRKSCYCSYCGNKIHMDDDVKRVEITKNINYHKTYTDEARIRESEAQERMRDKKYAADKAKWEREEKTKNKSAIRSFLIKAICVVAFLLVFVGYFGSEKKASDEQEKELKTIVEEVMEDIENENFEAAHVKAETIYYTAGWSSDIEDKWDATRKELIKQIEAAEKETEKATQKAEKEKKKSEGKDEWWNPFD